MEYTIQYFIDKFEAIPEEKWITGVTKDVFGNCCAIGHLGAITSNFDFKGHSGEVKALLGISGKDEDGLPVITNVNDGYLPYKNLGSTPKQRVINYLKSLQ